MCEKIQYKILYILAQAENDKNDDLGVGNGSHFSKLQQISVFYRLENCWKYKQITIWFNLNKETIKHDENIYN